MYLLWLFIMYVSIVMYACIHLYTHACIVMQVLYMQCRVYLCTTDHYWQAISSSSFDVLKYNIARFNWKISTLFTLHPTENQLDDRVEKQFEKLLREALPQLYHLDLTGVCAHVHVCMCVCFSFSSSVSSPTASLTHSSLFWNSPSPDFIFTHIQTHIVTQIGLYSHLR